MVPRAPVGHMTPLNGDDPAFLETCHRWLLFHYHCKGCKYNENSCQYGKVCSYGKSTFTHVRGCHRGECSFPRCALIKSILRHHADCQDDDCRMCSPVCKYQARSKSAQAHSQAQTMAEISRAIPKGFCVEGSEQLPPLPAQLPSPQQGLRKRDSMNAQPEVQQQGCSSKAVQQQKQQNAGMLFEARHREHKRQFSSSLSQTSWSMDAAGTALTNSSAASSSGCTLTHAPSESLDAIAELQALQLEKPAQQQQRQPEPPVGQEQQPQQHQEQQQQSTADSSQQVPVKGQLPAGQQQLASPPVPPTGSRACCSPLGCISVPSSGGVMDHPAPHQAVGSWPVPHVAGGMPQQLRQSSPPQPPPPPSHHDQQSSSTYGSNALAMLMHPSLLEQQPMSFMPVLQPHNSHPQAILSQHQQLQHITALQAHEQRQAPLSFVREPALGAAMQCATSAGAFQVGLTNPTAHHHHHHHHLHHQPQVFGVVTTAVAAGAAAPQASGAAGAHIFPTHMPLNTWPFMSLPYNTFAQTLQQQPSQLGNMASGMSYTPVHHDPYGSPGNASSVLLPSAYPPYQHSQMPPQPLQQPLQSPQVMTAGSGAHVQGSSSGVFMGSISPGPLAQTSLGCGPEAMDSDGVAPGMPASWGPFRHPGLPLHGAHSRGY
ncbi:hypothetical protein VaNZ11_014221 [Volvox africanus]|uniref:histone acetyltransferase n=1 Tax=Volvox africanus TaxID=51714 RepID=A0ABQ5SJ50_9CHLO|nr:hypothetical protein VaNZ11_014221 [Volvox africanus]